MPHRFGSDALKRARLRAMMSDTPCAGRRLPPGEVEVVTADGQALGLWHLSRENHACFRGGSPAHLLMTPGAPGMALVFRTERNK